MLNTDGFNNRLQQILNYYNLSASAFAEKMGIGRSSISHIISGRNKPSLEFVLNILENFEEVHFDWLMYGKGDFPKKETTNYSTNENTSEINQTSLFENKGVNENNFEKKLNTSNSTDEKKEAEASFPVNFERNNISVIERVIIFYANGSFKEYKN